jgi:proteasome lid subunit RPN8/RPN11
MIDTLILPNVLRVQIEREALAAFPRECCGLIEGIAEADALRATTIHPARNLSCEDHRFEIDPADHVAAQRAARANGHAIIGCYHSHPNGSAQPSARDKAGALEEDFVWLVCGVDQAAATHIAAFLYENGNFRALRLQVTPAP